MDLLFVDGDHDYNATFQDLVAWARFVRPGGIVAGHDIFNPATRISDSTVRKQRFDGTGAPRGLLDGGPYKPPNLGIVPSTLNPLYVFRKGVRCGCVVWCAGVQCAACVLKERLY